MAAEPVGGRFQVGERIGGGTTGDVMHALDTQTGAPCVVKLVYESVFPTALALQRTERELKQLARLQSSSIARVLAFGRQGEQLWLALERLDGVRSLDTLIIEGGPMAPARAAAFIAAIGEALAEAARVGVIHRDLAPKNVLVDPSGAIKLINFGIAAPVTETVAGVPGFVAPEMIEGKPVDQRTNIYSLGAILYYLLAGQAPFAGDVEAVLAAHQGAEVVPPSQHAPVPAELDAVVLKALEKNATRRFMTFRQFVAEVQRVCGTDDSPSLTQPMGRVAEGAGENMAEKRQPSSFAKTMLGMAAMPDPRKPDRDSADAPSEVPAAAVSGAAGAGAAPAEEPFLPPARAPIEPQRQPPRAAGSPPEPGSHSQTAAGAFLSGGQSEGAPASAAPQPMAPQAAPQPMPPQPMPPQAAPQPMAPQAAPPQPMPPQVAPQPMAPQVAPQPMPPQAAPAGGKGKVKQPAAAPPAGRAKSKFRETMWFKKGELDAEAAEAAAIERARTGADNADRADSLPMDDRYRDDGSITHGDQAKFSLRTGSTQMMPAYKDPASGSVSEDELVGELKSGRGKILALIVLGVLVVVAVITFSVSQGDESPATDAPTEELAPAEVAP